MEFSSTDWWGPEWCLLVAFAWAQQLKWGFKIFPWSCKQFSNWNSNPNLKWHQTWPFGWLFVSVLGSIKLTSINKRLWLLHDNSAVLTPTWPPFPHLSSTCGHYIIQRCFVYLKSRLCWGSNIKTPKPQHPQGNMRQVQSKKVSIITLSRGQIPTLREAFGVIS